MNTHSPLVNPVSVTQTKEVEPVLILKRELVVAGPTATVKLGLVARTSLLSSGLTASRT